MLNKIYKSILNYIKENLLFLIVLIILLSCIFIDLPYGIYTPGGVININKRLDNVTYESSGDIDLTYVSYVKGSIPSLLMALILPSWDIVSTNDIKYDNEDIEDANEREKIYLYESVSYSKYVAYQKANIDLSIKSTTYYIIYIAEDANTDAKVGDKIISIDNKVVNDLNDLIDYTSSLKEGDVVNLKVLRNDKEKNVKATIYLNEDGVSKMGLAIDKIYEYEDGITYKNKTNEAGSSGGLMLTLAIYNALVEDDITDGKKLCGTGTIDLDGNVGEIAGVKYKLAGAVKNKCDVFIVPTDNYEEALNVKKKYNYDITLIEAKTFDQVLSELN